MADQPSNEGPSKSNISGESSDAPVELKIKTLDSQLYGFHVEKNMRVSVFKEKIANEIGVPVNQQRLIFRGRVLKDEHLLSEYQVENGHTLHLVERQPTQQQPLGDASSGEASRNSDNRGNDANASAPRNRLGQISHSVVLGSFNVGDQGEGMIPDLNRVIGAVLNSFGIRGQAGVGQTGGAAVSHIGGQAAQFSHGNETLGSHGNISGLTQLANHLQSSQAISSQPLQSPSEVPQIPPASAILVPSLHLPIPDSLSTLSEFMTRMEQTLSQNGYQPNTSSSSTRDQPRVQLPPTMSGLPTPEALGIVLQQAEQLLSGHTISALSHLAGRLEQDASSNDRAVRGQIQSESLQVGMAMQHLGALLLELGRTILTLRMGQSPVESAVNAGPAVYISSSGPNPIMVQPFPLQTSSMFGGSTPPSNLLAFDPTGIGNASRNVNIHIHAGTSLGPLVSTLGARSGNGEGTQGERVDVGSNIIAEINSLARNAAATLGARSGNGEGTQGERVDVGSNIVAEINSLARNAAATLGARSGNGERTQGERVDVGSNIVAEINSLARNAAANLHGDNSNASCTVEPHTGNEAGSVLPPSAVATSGSRESGGSLDGGLPTSDGSKRQDKDVQVQVSNQDARNDLLGSKDESCLVGSSSTNSSVKLENSSENAPSSSDVHDRNAPSSSDVHDRNAPSSSERHDSPDDTKAVPLGLGLGGLDRKKRTRQVKSANEMAKAPINQDLNGGLAAQQVFQSLASHGTRREGANDTSSVQLPASAGRNTESGSLPEQHADGQLDAADFMSQVIHSPALDGLLTGFSEQAGVGSPNILRNMLQQLTSNPQIMSTVGQIAQQVERQDVGNLFSGLGGGQGGSLDLSRMMEQMMPVVSQVLGQSSGPNQTIPAVALEAQRPSNELESRGAGKTADQSVQIDLQQVAERIEHFDAPRDVFRAVIENAVRLNGNESNQEDIMQDLGSNEALANDYMEMLRHDICRRLEGNSEHEH